MLQESKISGMVWDAGKFKMRKQFAMLFAITISALTLRLSTSTIRQHNWQPQETAYLCCSQTNTERLTIKVNTLIQCLAYTQPRFAERGLVTFKSTFGLCTISDPSAISSIYGQMYESDLAPVGVNPITEPCNTSSWTMTFKTRSNRSVVFGDKISLFAILSKGADVKIQIGENIFLESSYMRMATRNNEWCSVTLIQISKTTWDTYDPDLSWEMTIACTDGKVFIAKQSIGANTLISAGYENMDVTWYTRKLPEDPKQINPIYYHNENGEMLKGSKETLVSCVKGGKGVKMVSPSLSVVYSPDRLEINGSNIVGQVVFQVNADVQKAEYLIPLYWLNILFSTHGIAAFKRFHIGEHIHQQQWVRYTDNAWYVDVCWGFAFMHSATGSEISGSIENLKAHILIARQVRVLFDSYSMEADNIFISNTQIITAQFLSQMDTPQPMVFSNGHWKWLRISTDGSFQTDTYEMGSSAKISNSALSSKASWFVQIREWIQMLVTSSNGTAVEGTKTALVNAIRQWSSLRCVVHFETKDILVFTAESIEISNDGNVAAMMFRYIQFDDETPGPFVPYWRILLMCTTGKLQESRWTVGEHVKRGEKWHDVTTHWFVDI